MVLQVEKARRLCVAFVAVDRVNIATCLAIGAVWNGKAGRDSDDSGEMKLTLTSNWNVTW